MKYFGNRGSEDYSLEPNFNAITAEFYRSSDIKKLIVIDLSEVFTALDIYLTGTTDLLFQIFVELIITLDIQNNDEYEMLQLELENFLMINELLTSDDVEYTEYHLFMEKLSNGSLDSYIQHITTILIKALNKPKTISHYNAFPYNWCISTGIKNKSVILTLATKERYETTSATKDI